jgi:hypothetical protein
LLISRRSSPEGIFSGGVNAIDRAFLLWAVFFLVIFSAQWMLAQAFIKSLGNFLDALGAYLVMRFLIRDRDDIRQVITVSALICVFLGVCMINEQMTGQNIFGLIGGVNTEVQGRDGSLRSQATFGTYITAGVFGATLLPLFVWLWIYGKSRIGALGIVGATVMTATAHSSTPLVAYVAGIAGLCFWRARRSMRLFRWGIVFALIALHLIMKAPVWALINRLDLTGSSSSFHRFKLVDHTIRHFTDWWLLGYKYYDQWGYDMWDLSNQYIAYALRGGLATIVMFILVISRSFGRLGNGRKLAAANPMEEWLYWCLGSAMISHVVSYLGINYFDQMQFAWYALLAMICAMPMASPSSAKALNGDVSETMQWNALETAKS